MNVENISLNLENLLTQFIAFLPSIITALVIFFGGLVIAGLVKKKLTETLKKRDFDVELTLVLGQVTRWTLIGLFTMSALRQVNFDLTAFLAGLGFVGFTVGFALQDVSKNFFAGLLLLLEQPFELGESIEVNGISGTVESVKLRATIIKTFDGKLVSVPNGDVFTNAITNYSRADRRRVSFSVGVAYGSNMEEVRRVAVETLRKIEGVLEDPAPEISFNNFGGSTLDFTTYFWVDTDITGVRGATDRAIVALEGRFNEAGIEMPFPTRDLIVSTNGHIPVRATQ